MNEEFSSGVMLGFLFLGMLTLVLIFLTAADILHISWLIVFAPCGLVILAVAILLFVSILSENE